MIYITLLDQFHPGIYSSQVIDVCDYLNQKHNAKIRLVAFLSIRELRNTDAKKRLKALSPDAIILPSFPGLKNFQLTSILLFFVCLFTGERVAICRNVFCTKMALRLKKWGMLKKVVMDGRSAMAAEIGEYDVFPVEYLRRNVAAFEKYAVTHSDFRMAVSQKLVDYWRQHYAYNGNEHIVIPCTLDRKYFDRNEFHLSGETKRLKTELGFAEDDIILVYSGSTAPWQSFDLLEKLLSPILDNDPRFKILFLSKSNKDNERMQQKYPGRVVVKWLEHKDVLPHLQCCDYGILVREQSDTNLVASPVKFAEYLYAGLKVFISVNLGDFSEFVIMNDCGYVIDEDFNNWSSLQKVEIEEKEKCFVLSQQFFRKESLLNDHAYAQLMEAIKN